MRLGTPAASDDRPDRGALLEADFPGFGQRVVEPERVARTDGAGKELDAVHVHRVADQARRDRDRVEAHPTLGALHLRDLVRLPLRREVLQDDPEATIARLKRPETDLGTFREEFASLTTGSGAVAMLLAGSFL